MDHDSKKKNDFFQTSQTRPARQVPSSPAPMSRLTHHRNPVYDVTKNPGLGNCAMFSLCQKMKIPIEEHMVLRHEIVEFVCDNSYQITLKPCKTVRKLIF